MRNLKPIVVMAGGGIKTAACASRFSNDHELVFLHVDFGERAAAAQMRSLTALADALPHAATVSTNLPHLAEIDSQCREEKRIGGRSEKNGIDGPSPVARLGLLPALAAVAVQCAVRIGARRIVTGLSELVDASHLGIRRPSDGSNQLREWLYFSNAMTAAVITSREPIVIEAPLLDLTYPEMIKQAFHFEMPLEHTWSCEKDSDRPCTRCPNCQTRAAAFSEASRVDPIVDLVTN